MVCCHCLGEYILFHSNSKRGSKTACIHMEWIAIFVYNVASSLCFSYPLLQDSVKRPRPPGHPTEYHTDYLISWWLDRLSNRWQICKALVNHTCSSGWEDWGPTTSVLGSSAQGLAGIFPPKKKINCCILHLLLQKFKQERKEKIK